MKRLGIFPIQIPPARLVDVIYSKLFYRATVAAAFRAFPAESSHCQTAAVETAPTVAAVSVDDAATVVTAVSAPVDLIVAAAAAAAVTAPGSAEIVAPIAATAVAADS